MRFERRPEAVEAVRFGPLGPSQERVKRWAEQRGGSFRLGDGDKARDASGRWTGDWTQGYLTVGVRGVPVYTGHWLVGHPDGTITVMTDEEFRVAYRPASGVDKDHD